MKLGASVGMRDEPESFAQQARRLEQAGVDYLWSGEAYTADAVSALGFLAAVTRRAHIGSSILPLYTRTPALLAMTAVGLDKLSGGRFILGLGASGPQVVEGFHGVPYDAPLARTEEVIEICRSVWRRDRLEHSGKKYQIPLAAGQGTGLGKPLKLIDHPVRDAIPVFVAATGPKNVQSAARIADGWIPIFFWPERSGQVWGEALAAGLGRRDPALGPLEVVASVTVAVGEGLEDLRETARPQLALYIGGMGARQMNFYNDLACRYGLEGPAKQIQDLYLSGHKDEAARAVPAELIEGTTMIGPPGLVRDRLAAYREAGVTLLTIRPVGPDPLRTIARVRELLE
jgi:F420-dependent oxidoreductase-like protein